MSTVRAVPPCSKAGGRSMPSRGHSCYQLHRIAKMLSLDTHRSKHHFVLIMLPSVFLTRLSCSTRVSFESR